MHNFIELFDQYSWTDVQESIQEKTAADVEQALHNDMRDLEDFKALISPAAAAYLEDMARLSQQLTIQRFGRTIQLFAPMYLSNECQNICTYCGFSFNNKLKRKTLSPHEILVEVQSLKALGFRHILLVSGEANTTVGVAYFQKALAQIVPHFDQVSMEVQPLGVEEYSSLVECGLHSVLVYQETYHEETYRKHHPKGKKAQFNYRIATPDRLGKAGVHKVGLGILIGLEDWRTDSFFVALHFRYLQKTYWQTKYSLSFPRLRPFSGGLAPKVNMTERELVQLITAYRLLDADVELSLSTRETSFFRDHVFKLGITSMSAGSKTNPGGYAVEPRSLEQFEISDERSSVEVAQMLMDSGYEPVWKDWDHSLQHV